ncbi:ALP1-like protein [Tanacetum coccineum]
MARPLFFNEIVTAVIDHDLFFCNNIDYTGKEGIFGLLKCTSSIRQLAYDVHPEFLDELYEIYAREVHVEFIAPHNGVTYRSGYYLVDGIYPELAPLVKTIPELANDDHKRILFKQKQESARKDVERAFGVLKKKWAIPANPTRTLKKEKIINMMYTCIILHNMIRKYKKYAISAKWFPEEAHQPDDPFRNEEQVQQVMSWIRSSQAHQNLRHDLIEHLSRNA